VRRPILGLVIAFALAGIILVVVMGDDLSRPATRIVGKPPPDLHATSVRIATSPNEFVSGWFSRGTRGIGAILLLHGVRSDRTQMLARGRFLTKAGYSVLLIDLPAHGESSGARITFGVHEAEGVKAALEYLRGELPSERIGVIAVSLGAASLVLSKAAPATRAVVLESMYPTITEAVQDRLTIRLGPLGRYLAPLLVWQLPLRLHVSPDQLRPIVEVSTLGAPVLIVSGTSDRHTTWAETERIFQAAQEPKELWPVEGAMHVDLYAYNPEAYQLKILTFLRKYLRDG